jgi:hypothetical protein
VNDRNELEAQYKAILDTAARQAPITVPAAAPVAPDASFFFPWEHSAYRANGSSSAESGQQQ